MFDKTDIRQTTMNMVKEKILLVWQKLHHEEFYHNFFLKLNPSQGNNNKITRKLASCIFNKFLS